MKNIKNIFSQVSTKLTVLTEVNKNDERRKEVSRICKDKRPHFLKKSGPKLFSTATIELFHGRKIL